MPEIIFLIGDEVSYVVCDKCGGYYELQKGESADDPQNLRFWDPENGVFEGFEACQCGGNLRYVENKPQSIEENNKPKLMCSNCLKESEGGVFCPNCGGKLIPVKNKDLFANVSIEESKELERLARNASKRDKISKDKNNVNEVDEEPKELLQRINWLSVLAGTGFFIICNMISIALLFYPVMSSYYSYGYSSSYSGIVFALLAVIIMGFIFAVISGGLASFTTRSRDYGDGLINGFLVGLVSSIVLGIFGGFLSVIIGIVIFGALSTIGGAIGIFVRNKFVDK